MQRVIASQKNSKELREAAGRIVTDRWLDPKPSPAASGAPGTPQRYFGAR